MHVQVATVEHTAQLRGSPLLHLMTAADTDLLAPVPQPEPCPPLTSAAEIITVAALLASAPESEATLLTPPPGPAAVVGTGLLLPPLAGPAGDDPRTLTPPPRTPQTLTPTHPTPPRTPQTLTPTHPTPPPHTALLPHRQSFV